MAVRRFLVFWGNRWLCFVVVIGILLPVAGWARTWRSRDGKTVDARFVKMVGAKVRMRRDRDGKLIDVPLSALCEEDQEYVGKLLKKADAGADGSSAGAEGSSAGASVAFEPITVMKEAIPFAGLLVEAGPGVLLFWFGTLFLMHVVFIYIASLILRFRAGFWDAVKTVLLELVLMGIIIGATALAISLIGELAVLLLLTIFLAGPVAILVIYEREFFLSLLAYVLALVLTGIANAVFFLVLAILQT